MWAYWLLVGLLVLFGGLGFGLLLYRLKEMPKVPEAHTYWSREFAIFLGSAALVIVALFVIVGTSSPLITGLLTGKTTAVDISYYSTTTIPLGIAIGLLAGVGQLLWWTRSKKEEVLRSLMIPFGLACFSILGFYLLGVRQPMVAVFLFGAVFALVANVQVGLRLFRGNPKYAGGAVAHVGIALMFLGFVASSNYDAKETLSLTQGEAIDALGYRLTYAGYVPLGNEKYAFRVEVEKDGQKRTVAPIMYYSDYTKGLMRTPDILNLFSKDFYLAPLSLEEAKDRARTSGQTIELKQGGTARLEGMEITFVDFDLPDSAREAMLQGAGAKVGARLQVKEYGKEPVTVIPAKFIKGGESEERSAQLGNRYEFTLGRIQVSPGSNSSPSIEIAVLDLSRRSASQQDPGKDILVVEASVKPGINLVWAGVIVLLVGMAVTIVRRAREAARVTSNT
jgi:cytochrome c-type biogenesis protein CcmF